MAKTLLVKCVTRSGFIGGAVYMIEPKELVSTITVLLKMSGRIGLSSRSSACVGS